jgi:hypothetical protein
MSKIFYQNKYQKYKMKYFNLLDEMYGDNPIIVDGKSKNYLVIVNENDNLIIRLDDKFYKFKSNVPSIINSKELLSLIIEKPSDDLISTAEQKALAEAQASIPVEQAAAPEATAAAAAANVLPPPRLSLEPAA